MMGADVVVARLRCWGPGRDGQLDELHDVVARKLAGQQYMADFDAECGTSRGPSGWTRDRVQHAVATAIAHDSVFAARVRQLL
ncbi:hypothetical protein GCM10022223_66100 [Kineosporia mesophila]|uniref:Uncharacterized protein n=1 Tax=Kineosporia mesophila TaxID=566012 RepID=A0ABP7AQV3_9ACTN|nr:hypothetical protein [Kineosporia mesophila]MCD5349142.1 hypothetical protein [Kineosporia mesophila]